MYINCDVSTKHNYIHIIPSLIWGKLCDLSVSNDQYTWSLVHVYLDSNVLILSIHWYTVSTTILLYNMNQNQATKYRFYLYIYQFTGKLKTLSQNTS